MIQAWSKVVYFCHPDFWEGDILDKQFTAVFDLKLSASKYNI